MGGNFLAKQFWLDVLELHPTQFAVGMRMVMEKEESLVSYTPKERARYLEKHPVPVVLGPGNICYMVDRHHLTRACWQADIENVFVHLWEDWSHLYEGFFWRRMNKMGWVYLYDQFGLGPRRPELLPENVLGLADDPYRSLARAIREAGGYSKVNNPYAEFVWANFFRKKVDLWDDDKDFWRALEKGMRLAKSRPARRLPGFLTGI